MIYVLIPLCIALFADGQIKKYELQHCKKTYLDLSKKYERLNKRKRINNE